jgi:hypothetical protein
MVPLMGAALADVIDRVCKCQALHLYTPNELQYANVFTFLTVTTTYICYH